MLLESQENYFQGFGEINTLFVRGKGTQIPLGAQQSID